MWLQKSLKYFSLIEISNTKTNQLTHFENITKQKQTSHKTLVF